LYVIITLVLVIAIGVTAVLVYKNNQAKADAAMASVQSAADKVKADAAAVVDKAKEEVAKIKT